MRKILFLIVLLLIIFSGCSSSGIDGKYTAVGMQHKDYDVVLPKDQFGDADISVTVKKGEFTIEISVPDHKIVREGTVGEAAEVEGGVMYSLDKYGFLLFTESDKQKSIYFVSTDLGYDFIVIMERQ